MKWQKKLIISMRRLRWQRQHQLAAKNKGVCKRVNTTKEYHNFCRCDRERHCMTWNRTWWEWTRATEAPTEHLYLLEKFIIFVAKAYAFPLSLYHMTFLCLSFVLLFALHRRYCENEEEKKVTENSPRYCRTHSHRLCFRFKPFR